MKLSEAIRLGSMLKPQAFGTERGQQRVPGWRGRLLGKTQPTTCAFSAALEAHPVPYKRVPVSQVAPIRGAFIMADADGMVLTPDYPERWFVTLRTIVPCPACGGEERYVFALIPHLNDTHLWTREQIADWVESVEPAETTDAAPQPVDVRVGQR